MGLHRTKKLLHSQGNHQQNTKATYWMEKEIFKSYIQKGANIQNVNKLYNSVTKKQTIWLENRHRIWIGTFPKTYRWPIGPWKDAQHYSSSGKCKTKSQYHLTSARIAIIKRTRNDKCRQGCEETGTLIHCWRHGQLVQPLQKTVQELLKKLKIELQYKPEILLHPKKMNTLIEKIYTPVFTEALFTIAKICKQPNCPSMDKEDVVCIHTHTHMYNGILLGQKIEILPSVTTWMSFEGILSEVSLTYKDKHCMISLTCRIQKTKSNA